MYQMLYKISQSFYEQDWFRPASRTAQRGHNLLKLKKIISVIFDRRSNSWKYKNVLQIKTIEKIKKYIYKKIKIYKN
jgi:hypothetical protein